MSRALAAVLCVAWGASCRPTVVVNFGEAGEGLDGFLCRESTPPRMLLDRLGADAGTRTASLVTDFIGIENGQPGCRTGQLIRWCSSHACKPLQKTRVCTSVEFPTGVSAQKREDVRSSLQTQFAALKGKEIIGEAPDEFVILRVIATAQPCEQLAATAAGLPEFDSTQLLGCAYSCPTLFSRADDVYLGFETLTASCEQGVRICASSELHWAP